MSVIHKSRLAHWSERIRAFEKKAENDESSGSPIRVWVVGPLRQALGGPIRFALTIIAILIVPRALHSLPPDYDNPFISDRAFVIGAIAIYEFLGGRFVYATVLDNIANPILKTIIQSGADIIALLLLVAIFALIFLIGAYVAKAQLGLVRAIRLSCYSMGVIQIMQIFTTLPIMLVMPDINAQNTFSAVFGLAAILIMSGTFWLIYATFIFPVRILYPTVSKARLWLGWWVGWLFGMATLFSISVFFSWLFPGQSFQFGFF